MRINVINLGESYSFLVQADSSDRIVFSSTRHHELVPFVQRDYRYAWQACKDASELVKRRSYHIEGVQFSRFAREDLVKPIVVDISAEQMLVDHYARLYEIIDDKVRSSQGDAKEEEMSSIELSMIITELETVIETISEEKDKRKMSKILDRYKKLFSRFFPHDAREKKTASKETQALIDCGAKEEVLETIASQVCRAIQKNHPGAVYLIVNSPLGHVKIFDVEKDADKAILQLHVNDDLHLDSIMPCGDLYDVYPYHSVKFYQKYWKPIVEGVGHFYIEDSSTLLMPGVSSLPDIPKDSGTYTLEGWDTNKNKEEKINISFRGDKPIWIFEASKTSRFASTESKYTEQDYLNSVVKCIDPELQSIFQRTGSAQQIIPCIDHIEVDVDFGRGLGTVRLTEKQLEIVNDL